MLHLFDKQDNPPKRDNNAIKTFKPQNRNLRQQQNRNQVKSNRNNINGPFTFNRNNQTQFGAISYQAQGWAIPKQYSKPIVRNNQNVGQQRTNQTGNSNFNSNSNFNPNFNQRQTQSQNYNSNFNQKQTQNQNHNPNFSQRQTQKSNIILCRRCGRTGHKLSIRTD